jgi:hypothetical protein
MTMILLIVNYANSTPSLLFGCANPVKRFSRSLKLTRLCWKSAAVVLAAASKHPRPETKKYL